MHAQQCYSIHDPHISTCALLCLSASLQLTVPAHVFGVGSGPQGQHEAMGNCVLPSHSPEYSDG